MSGAVYILDRMLRPTPGSSECTATSRSDRLIRASAGNSPRVESIRSQF